MSQKLRVEVCFSPVLFPFYMEKEAITVVVDILRASSAICTAFMNGVEKIIPVGTIEEAKRYKQQGFLVAAERDGIVKDFADFGNSPFNFTSDRVSGKEIVYSTTNGTQAINLASETNQVLVGAFLNISAITKYITQAERNVIILCAGWKNKFNLEDSLFAGALAKNLLMNEKFFTECDSCNASLDLWGIASNNILKYLDKAAQRHRLKKNGLDDVMEFCHTQDLTPVIPVLKGQFLVRLENDFLL